MSNTRLSIGQFCVTWLFVLVAGGVEADDTATMAEHFAYRTVYLQEAIDGFHQIAIVGFAGGAGIVELDPNTCTINEFGDTQICTLIAKVERRIRIRDTGIVDPFGMGRRLYQLDGTGLPNPLLIMLPEGEHEAARLIHNNRGPNAPRAVTLERLVWNSVEKDGHNVRCVAHYVSVQLAGQVFVAAAGTHPTSGYHTSLVELPITVYPPQFRLVCVPPSGIVTQQITPFMVTASFPAQQSVSQVVVWDAAGRHEVNVRQISLINPTGTPGVSAP